MNEINLDQKIEAVLFLTGEPMSLKKLSVLLDSSKEEVLEAIKMLDDKLKHRGLCLVYKDEEIMLGTKPELSSLLERFRKEDLNKELSKASFETLSIILYKRGATRSEIDYVRGVNSSFILRNLLIRGLIEKITHPRDTRKYFYKPTFELLNYLGVSFIEELPEYAEIGATLSGKIAEMQSEESSLN